MSLTSEPSLTAAASLPQPQPSRPSSSGAAVQAAVDDPKLAVILEPYYYLIQQRGKEIRAKLIMAFDAWLHVPPAKLAIITDIIQMLHTASLIIDDVEDNSDLRRGIPVAHKVYGVASSINAANYVYFLALQRIADLENPSCVSIFTEELLQLHRGQGMEIYWRDNLICPDLDEYLEMIGN
ncbi:geranylgeranyl pyrophosphate synthetase, partial [Cladochytrium tenue]